ncbi:uncharacterized protein LOC115565575 [Drosophila navojoa]|uniref:uncharacterized protein LOC115565575 n=1 Tax=Drosophila navojoa TaxID=7232 RepID=UPI0011BE767C|nr:uncharacterized protein LOC115565575 [Drosophila navojoa]
MYLWIYIFRKCISIAMCDVDHRFIILFCMHQLQAALRRRQRERQNRQHHRLPVVVSGVIGKLTFDIFYLIFDLGNCQENMETSNQNLDVRTVNKEQQNKTPS